MTASDRELEKASDGAELMVVGIGASAGGLSALRTFFEQIPEDSGLAFVVVVHLSPEHESHLAEVLQPHLKMPTLQVNETTPLEPNKVYIIPPGANLNAVDTHLRLSKLQERRERAPIDHFFRTMAHTHDGRSVAIILTGTGSDGTLGLQSIHAQSGLTIVQDPQDAEYDGMPQSAVSTGIVDLILPLAKIPAAVLKYAKTQPQIPVPVTEEGIDGQFQQFLHKIFAQLRASTGRDFTLYKRSTLIRRIVRRMQFHYTEDPGKYLQVLREEPEEVRDLADDLLITVTNFFRDQEVFEFLEQDVIPKLFAGKRPDDDLRVWSVGCATGEEVYSLAMLLVEEGTRRDVVPRIQIFASDLHEPSLDKAREGFYPGDIATDISPERINRFFNKEEGGYRVRKELREMVVFSPHNLLGDPPFSRLDLIVCRNLLIYLQRPVQGDIFELFHYALAPDGFLLLGTSETLDSADLFQSYDKTRSVYRKRNVPGPEPKLPVFPLTRSRLPGERKDRDPETEPLPYGKLHQRIVEQYAPPSLLINPDDKVVHLSAHSGRYLVHPGGELTASLLKLAREELRVDLRSVLHIVREQGRAVETKLLPVNFDGHVAGVRILARPSLDPNQDGFVLVIFDERELDAESAAGSADPALNDAEIRELQGELDLTRQRLRAIIEADENSREELKASNEELQSANEELRSTMEELETSKEELQSMNEELQTVNQENRHKMRELSQLSSDLQNLLSATNIATLFLDREMRILRFTPKVGELFNVRMTDRGRPLSDFSHCLGDAELEADAKRVLNDLVPVESEVRDERERWYLTRILPYRSTEDRIDGVVITFVDITRRMQTEQSLRESEARYRTLFESIDQGFCIIEVLFDEADQPVDYVFLEVNDAFEAQTGLKNAENQRMKALVPSHDDRWFQIYGDVAKTGKPIRFQHEATGLDREYDVYAFRVGEPIQRRVAVLFSDITESRRAEVALREGEERLRLAAQATGFGTYDFEPETGLSVWSDELRAIKQYSGPIPVPLEETYRTVHPADRERFISEFERALDSDQSGQINLEYRIVRPHGTIRWLRNIGRTYFIGENEERRATRVIGTVQDITERHEAAEALRNADQRKTEFLALLAHELRNPLAPIRTGLEALRMVGHDANERTRICRILDAQSRQLTTLVNDLLDVSRITQGQLELRLRQVNLNTVLQNAVEAAQPHIESAGHNLQISLTGDAVILTADPHRLSQVFSNLLNNAAKYTPQGGELRLVAEFAQDNQEADLGGILVRVTDNGLGIAPEFQETVFETFSRVGSQEEGDSDGLGIGLSLVKSLVEMHDGRVEVFSDGLGQGSEFRVWLPVAKINSDEMDASDRTGDDQPAMLPKSMRPLRILIADDNAAATEMLAVVLARYGHELRTASTGRQAVAVAEAFLPEIVLLDIGMPEMNGYNAARHIRSMPWGESMRLIALTGWGNESDRERTAEAGFDHHLVKPVETDELLWLLEESSQPAAQLRQQPDIETLAPTEPLDNLDGVSHLAHETRASLQTVVMGLDLLREERENAEEVDRLVQKIREEAIKPLTESISKLIDFVRQC